MNEKFLKLKKEISSIPDKDNLVSVLIYGSILDNKNNRNTINDLDIIIVVKKVDSTLNNLFKLLLNKYKNIDFNVYSYEEILNDLSFYTREFKLEYLAKGLCIYGKNIFHDEFLKVNNYEYKQSILIRSIEHLQMVRQKYFSSSLNYNQKFDYLKKYFIRISKNILLFCGVDNYSSVNKLDKNEIFKKLITIGMFDVLPDIDNIKKLDEYFNLFNIISKVLIRCKKDFDLQ